MAKRDDAKVTELAETKIPCRGCAIKPEEKRYAAKNQIVNPHRPDSEPFVTEYKCAQGKDDCGTLKVYNFMDRTSHRVDLLETGVL